MTHAKPAEREIGYVPQEGVLFHTMTVKDNLAFALEIRKWKQSQIDERVDELANLLGITGLLNRTPFGLSGGETQRVALGRALAPRPAILCLDEPLSALDEATRSEICDLLNNVQHVTGVTALHITHNLSESDRLGDVKLTISDGVVQSLPGSSSAKAANPASSLAETTANTANSRVN
jgi:ABC-type sugar transport system ATPase subunit